MGRDSPPKKTTKNAAKVSLKVLRDDTVFGGLQTHEST